MRMKDTKRCEATEQVLVMQWSKLHERLYPSLRWLYHCPNGGSRNGFEAANLKQQGVKAGVPDLHLPIARGRYIGLYLELKYRGGKVTESQVDWISGMVSEGHFAVVCYGMDAAVKVLLEYITLADQSAMSFENGTVVKSEEERYV